MEKLIIVAGPTASGKTTLAVALAKRYNGEIISADSMQIYKYMDIGTAQPTKEEMQGIAHYLIGELEPDDEYNVSIFISKAKEYIKNITLKAKMPIIAGGTGLYIDALLYDYNLGARPSDYEIKSELENKLNTFGAEYMHDMLKELDSEEAEKIHKNNTKRVLRALEICLSAKAAKSQCIRCSAAVYNAAYICLVYEPRNLLYERINKRVDIMFGSGLLEQARELYDKNYDKSSPSMQAIGYKELFDFFDNKINIEQAKELIKKRTRNYAKRQITWFKKNNDVKTFNVNAYTSFEELLADICKYIEEKTGINGTIK